MLHKGLYIYFHFHFRAEVEIDIIHLYTLTIFRSKIKKVLGRELLPPQTPIRKGKGHSSPHPTLYLWRLRRLKPRLEPVSICFFP